MSGLSNYEKETIILFNEAEKTAIVDTANESLKKRLDRFCEESDAIFVAGENEPFKKYNLPKKWIKVKMPRKISDEQRARLANMGRENFSKRRTEEN